MWPSLLQTQTCNERQITLKQSSNQLVLFSCTLLAQIGVFLCLKAHLDALNELHTPSIYTL